MPRTAGGWAKLVIVAALGSIVIQFLALGYVVYRYNRACYENHWMTSRPYFGDVAAPLYARLEDWVERDVDFSPHPLHLVLMHLRARLPRVSPPIALFAGWFAFVVAQFALRRRIASWAVPL